MLEKELVCAVSTKASSFWRWIKYETDASAQICTDILYQPLTLLDCLHTFCGSCLKEWFTWQAASAAQSRRNAHPYTCPSCRESVRGTKADWRLTTLLDGYLKANPDKAKSEQEKEEMRQIYKPGDDVLQPVEFERQESDSEDERLINEVRQISMADAGSDAARRGAERMARHRRQQEAQRRRERGTPEALARRQHSTRWADQRARLTESTLRQHDGGETRIEHQPSLRSLLSASDGDSGDVQAEILRSIHAEGVLDGLDLDNLTTEQEEELTDRIAEAYRRRQQQRDRSRNRERRSRGSTSPRLPTSEIQAQRDERQTGTTAAQQETRSRPPASRPHLLEHTLQDPSRGQRRSPSATSQQSSRSGTRSENTAPAARSATDLSQQPSSNDAQRERRRGLSSTGRSITDPQTSNDEHNRRPRADSSNSRNETTERRPQHLNITQPPSTAWANAGQRSNSATSLPRSPPATTTEHQHAVRPAPSQAAFAPELVSRTELAHQTTTCNRCEKSINLKDLHYSCSKCRDGSFTLCLRCYRSGQGCDHWFGFGFRAYDRWYRNAPPEGWPAGYEWPHVLNPRRYIASQANSNSGAGDNGETLQVQEGAFCESCFAFANDSYWYCNICLEGAWGFCDKCVQQGKHCTHRLLPVAHLSTLRQPHYDPTKASIVGLPHLPQDSYATLPVMTYCDICRRQILPSSTRFHCYQCSDGDYDVCNECYRNLAAQGKISEVNAANGWRRCLKGHRMAVVGYQDTSDGGHLRLTVREPVGGWAFKEDDISRRSQAPPGGFPPDGGVGMRCLALYSYFPADGVDDELAFPKNAEVREVENRNGDWFWGVYAGRINLFPSNHVRVL